MAKSKTSRHAEYSLPAAPLFYVNDATTDGAIVSKLAQLIPNTLQIAVAECPDFTKTLPLTAMLAKKRYRANVIIFTDDRPDHNETFKRLSADLVRQTAINTGCNFASVNLYFDEKVKPTNWGANHINRLVEGRPEAMTTTEIQAQAEAIYKWLFSVLTVKDTVHLIPEKQMRELGNNGSFQEYEYCPIGKCTTIKKDAKIKFIALIVSKPAVVSDNKLIWQVADHTGVANFYFKWRGPSSQHTWDWVLQLEPGQRKCLPRMPSVLVKEKILTTLIKAPIRIPGKVIQGTGETIKLVGMGISGVGKFMKMGSHKRWVSEADAEEYLKMHKNLKIVPGKEKAAITIFTEKGSKAWSDKDSDRSTLHGDEKASAHAKEDLLD